MVGDRAEKVLSLSLGGNDIANIEANIEDGLGIEQGSGSQRGRGSRTRNSSHVVITPTVSENSTHHLDVVAGRGGPRCRVRRFVAFLSAANLRSRGSSGRRALFCLGTPDPKRALTLDVFGFTARQILLLRRTPSSSGVLLSITLWRTPSHSLHYLLIDSAQDTTK